MRSLFYVLLVASPWTSLTALDCATGSESDQAVWLTLFNGKELRGWITGPDSHRVVED
jgi:hypothetical protein